ncbi:MAG: DUF309 domain-containing protein [Candidatus Marinarcus sp.]|uniref:DUF309 domain-containing protein n=1 Tax=Candidatus Marinarcus sp. TaxID=3100987 RepID=UPI003AFF98EB
MSAIKQFIQAVQNHEFAPAHEILEHDWKTFKQQGEIKKAKALQGLINGTTALALYIKGKPESFKKVWATFEKYQPLLDEIELQEHDAFFQARDLLIQKKDELIK